MIFALALATLVTAAGAGTSSPGALLADLRSATHCASWTAATIHLRGTHAGGGFTGAYDERDDARDGRIIVSARDGPFARAYGFDGATAWSQDYTGGSHALDAPGARAAARTRAWLAQRGWCRASAFTAESIAGAPGTDALRIRPRGGAALVLILDRTSHLPQQTALTLDESREVVGYDDWRDVDGVPFPFVRTVTDPVSGDRDRITLVSVTRERPAHGEGRRYARPAAPDDVHLLTGGTSVRVPYLLDGNKPIVMVSIDGRGPFPFVFDTGGHFILTAQTARQLGLHGAGSAVSVNQNQVTRVGFTRIRTLRIGDAVVRDQVAEINPYGFAKLERGPRPPKAGWLGLELLERFAITIDPVHRVLLLAPLAHPRPRPRGFTLPLVFEEDAPLVPCRLAGTAARCMIDTGNAGATIVNATWATQHRVVSRFLRGLAVGDGVFASRVPVALGSTVRDDEIVTYAAAGSPDAETFAFTGATLSERLLDGFVATLDYGSGTIALQPLAWYPPAGPRTGLIAAKREDGTFRVVSSLAGSPAAAAFRRGDIIVRVAGIPAASLSGADLSRVVNDPAASSRTFSIVRAGRPLRVVLQTRTLIPFSALRPPEHRGGSRRPPGRPAARRLCPGR